MLAEGAWPGRMETSTPLLTTARVTVLSAATWLVRSVTSSFNPRVITLLASFPSRFRTDTTLSDSEMEYKMLPAISILVTGVAWPITVFVTRLLDKSQVLMFLEPMARMEPSLFSATEYTGSWVCLMVSTRHCLGMEKRETVPSWGQI